jgi:integrase
MSKSIYVKFTADNVETLYRHVPEGKSDFVIWDEDLHRFGIRWRGKSGRYYIEYSHKNKSHRMAIGVVGQMSLSEARASARIKFGLVSDKKDPHIERMKEDTKSGDAFPAKIEAFCTWLATGAGDRPARTKQYVEDVRRSLMRRFSDLHRYGVGDIPRRLISDTLEELAGEFGPRSAGVSRAHLSSYYEYLMLKGFEGHNPVSGTERYGSRVRTRVLTPEELGLIWKATDTDSDFHIIVRLLILTAARKNVFGQLLRTEYVKGQRRLDLPASRNKNSKRFWLALSRQADSILNNVLYRRHNRSPYVFGRTKDSGFDGWSKGKEELDAKITELNGGTPLEHWVFHDFRRTFNTLGVDLAGIDEATADVCLHHVGEAKKGIKGVYNHAHFIIKKHEAMQVWADFIDDVVHGKRDFEVIRGVA